jgi:DNA-directed RNA polymerase subunit RPC12/RpoP
MNTDCKKCGAKMPPEPKTTGIFAHLSFKTTAYRCDKCGHWNKLKMRKGWK